jgi:hypothetical protein
MDWLAVVALRHFCYLRWFKDFILKNPLMGGTLGSHASGTTTLTHHPKTPTIWGFLRESFP